MVVKPAQAEQSAALKPIFSQVPYSCRETFKEPFTDVLQNICS